MTGPIRFDDAYDEPDQLRDQLRQLLRYRAFIVLGVLLGLLGGLLAATLGMNTYTSTGDVLVRTTAADPLESGTVSLDKQLSMGTERQIALSATVATRAAEALGEPGNAVALQRDLRVSNPPDTQVLRFEYTAGTPKRAARLTNAFVDAYLADRRDRTEATVGRVTSALDKQLKPLTRQRAALDEQIAQQLDGPSKDADVAERGALQTQISDLQKRISDLRSRDATGGDIMRKGEPPARPSGPGLVMLVVIGALVGLALGILLAWLRSVLEPRVRSVGDVQRNLRAPVLGILPRDRKGGGLLVVGRTRNSNLAEAYRTIAFRLAHDQRFTGRSSLLVVAPRENGDAAAVAVNLAGAFAEIGNDVLLVEADLRAPSLSERLPVARAAADGEPPAGTGWPDGRRLVVDAGEAGDFDLVPGRKVPNVARALSAPQVTRLLATPSDPNESVVVLTGPLLAHADGLALAKRVDGVLVVCDLQAVRRDDLDRVHELVTGAGGRILGAVLDKGSRHGRLRQVLDGDPLYRTGGGGRAAERHRLRRSSRDDRAAHADAEYLADGGPDDGPHGGPHGGGARTRDSGLMTFRG